MSLPDYITHPFPACTGFYTTQQLADARRIIDAAEKKAKEIGQPMNIAVVDEGANLYLAYSHGRRLDRIDRYRDQ